MGLLNNSWIVLAAGILQVFLFAPWVVRRTVLLNFPRLNLVVVRGDSVDRTHTMNYRESLSVAWLLIWRSAVIIMVITITVTTAIIIVRTAPAELEGWPAGFPRYLLQFGITLPLEVLIFIFMLKSVMRKVYAGFSLRLEWAEPAPHSGSGAPLESGAPGI